MELLKEHSVSGTRSQAQLVLHGRVRGRKQIETNLMLDIRWKLQNKFVSIENLMRYVYIHIPFLRSTLFTKVLSLADMQDDRRRCHLLAGVFIWHSTASSRDHCAFMMSRAWNHVILIVVAKRKHCWSLEVECRCCILRSRSFTLVMPFWRNKCWVILYN